MFGRAAIDLTSAAILLISVLAAATDLARGKIYNWLTLPAILAGILFYGWQGGLAAAAGAALGALSGLVLYGWMFMIGMMGGGDVKLLMALGAWGGARYCLDTAFLAVLVGGVMALGVLAARGKLAPFARKMKRFVLTLMVRELELETPKVDRSLTMPYGIPIAVAAIWTRFGDPLGALGVRPW